MKLEKILTICGASLFVGVALAAFIDDHGPVSTVAEALKMRDDTPVILEGKITRRLKKDTYQFTDSTGSITIEIDRKDWNGVDVRPTDTVRIQGEIDKDWLDTTIDVHSIKIVP
ncbi:MAG: NirD/YgiW/YdeI family stress tolerance protein [Alphaproteobacteria bacterium]|nr:NirD/YgiW/YdeI family stress tolerance protein [Alphaproteobacteria bacterium]